MTEYFEVTQRDCAARKGKLTLNTSTIHTPYILDAACNCILGNTGCLWRKQEAEDRISLHTYIPLPLEVPEEILREASRLTATMPCEEGARGVVVHPKGEVPKGYDVYIIGAAAELSDNPGAFTSTIIKIREHAPWDSALYTPALATSYNLALLIYSGVDLIDYTRASISACKDLYFTKTGSYILQNLKDLPCNCKVCSNHTPSSLSELPKRERSQLLEEHNRAAMDEELKLVTQLIAEGRLRDYIEGACRAEPWQTASLRHLDAQHTYLEKRTPVLRKNPLYACTLESQNRVEIKRFAQRIQTRYTPPKLDILLLLPCSARKPYSTSKSHQRIHQQLEKLTGYIHEVIITSPLGIVPRELELTYPAAHYDTPVTGHWSLEERAFTEACLTRYLTQHQHYKTIIAHVNAAYREICEKVASELSLEIIYTAQDNILSPESLNNLKEHIQSAINSKTPKQNSEERKKHLMRAIADYQFAPPAGKHLVPDESTVKAPYPRHQVYHENRQLASLTPQYGSLALTIQGAKRLSPLNRHRVKIDEFKPRGSILAAGVIDADPNIREGDEVIVENTQILAVGRARMCGEEMLKSTRGVAVDLRHTSAK
jgi:archaeosine synthase